jgi:glycosyltransferase involved in cell wall biosynthesis
MRIAYLTDTPRPGGAERVLEQLAEAAVSAGHDVVLLAPQRWLLERAAAAIPGLRTRELGFRASLEELGPAARLGALAAALPGLVGALRAERPDVLHVNNGGYPGSDLCRLAIIAGRLARVPRRLLTVHAVPRARAESIPIVQAIADRLVWASRPTVVGATAVVEQGLRGQRGMPAGLSWAQIPYGVAEPDGAQDAAAFRAQLGVPPDAILVGMVSATDDAQKGHRVLVEALAEVAGIHAAIVGADPPVDVLERVADLELGDRVAVAGRVPEIGPVYHAIDALVVPSIADESLPLVVLEAMAAARPVIASRLSGIPEAVRDGETGRLFEPGDVDGLASALRELAADPAGARAWGTSARAAWAQRYSLHAMTGATLALYERD